MGVTTGGVVSTDTQKTRITALSAFPHLYQGGLQSVTADDQALLGKANYL